MGIETQKIGFPKAVQLVAAVLMAKPLLDILMMQLVDIQSFNWVSWILLFAAGISLLVRHKTAWMFSIALCFAFVISTGITFMQEFDSSDSLYNTFKVIDCLLVFFVVGTVAYYFRYPYLDRRQSWLAPTADRFAIVTPIQLGSQQGTTVDLSYSGAYVLTSSGHSFKVDEKISVHLPEVHDLKCSAKIIAVEDKYARVQFEGLSSHQNQLLRQWLQSQNLQKV